MKLIHQIEAYCPGNMQDIEEAWGEGTATIEANDDGSYDSVGLGCQ